MTTKKKIATMNLKQAALRRMAKKHKPKGAKWFDAETKCRKAERTWMTGLDDLANSVQILLKQCAESLNDFRRKPDAATKFTEEMSILEKRQKWAAAIIEADDTSLSHHKQEQQAEEKQAMGDSQTTSQDVSALGRVGPCKDYQDLQTIAALKQMGAEFRTCTSAQQIKELNEKGATQKKPIATLLAAVKAAKSDLIAAEKRAQAQKKKEEDRAAKEAAKVAKAGAASGNAPGGEAGRARAASRSQVTRKKQSAQSILLDNNSELWQDETFRIRGASPRGIGPRPVQGTLHTKRDTPSTTSVCGGRRIRQGLFWFGIESH